MSASGSGSGKVDLTFSGGTEYEVGPLYSMIVTVTDPGQLRFGFSMVGRGGDDELLKTRACLPCDSYPLNDSSNDALNRSASKVNF